MSNLTTAEIVAQNQANRRRRERIRKQVEADRTAERELNQMFKVLQRIDPTQVAKLRKFKSTLPA